MLRHNETQMQEIPLSSLGSGFRTLDNTPLPNTALNISTSQKKASKNKSTSTTNTWMGIVENQEAFYHHLDIHSKSSATITSPFVDTTLSAKMKFIKNIEMNAQWLYFGIRKRAIYTESLKAGTFIKSNVLDQYFKTPQPSNSSSIHEKKNKNSLRINNFYANYGDSFINSITYGCEGVFVLKMQAQYQQKLEKSLDELGMQATVKKIPHMNADAEVKAGLTTKDIDNAEAYQGEYWLYTTGIREAKHFIPNTGSLRDLLMSINKLFRFEKDTKAEVPLKYHLLNYAHAIQCKPQIYSLFIDFALRVNKGKALFDKIKRSQQTLIYYQNELEMNWEKEEQKFADYKYAQDDGETAFEKSWKNLDLLSDCNAEFNELKIKLLFQAFSPENLKMLEREFTKNNAKLQNLIRDTPITEDDTLVKEVELFEGYPVHFVASKTDAESKRTFGYYLYRHSDDPNSHNKKIDIRVVHPLGNNDNFCLNDKVSKCLSGEEKKEMSEYLTNLHEKWELDDQNNIIEGGKPPLPILRVIRNNCDARKDDNFVNYPKLIESKVFTIETTARNLFWQLNCIDRETLKPELIQGKYNYKVFTVGHHSAFHTTDEKNIYPPDMKWTGEIKPTEDIKDKKLRVEVIPNQFERQNSDKKHSPRFFKLSIYDADSKQMEKRLSESQSQSEFGSQSMTSST